MRGSPKGVRIHVGSGCFADLGWIDICNCTQHAETRRLTREDATQPYPVKIVLTVATCTISTLDVPTHYIFFTSIGPMEFGVFYLCSWCIITTVENNLFFLPDGRVIFDFRQAVRMRWSCSGYGKFSFGRAELSCPSFGVSKINRFGDGGWW